MASVPTVKGKDGFEMPIIGFGTWQASGGDLENSVDHALEVGYRHIDTAFAYLNEEIIGKVLKRWLDNGKLKREELFIVTKLPIIGNRPERVEQFINRSLEKLQLDYVDLYLVHCPFGLNYHTEEKIFTFKPDGTADLDMETDIVAVWKEMEKQKKAGKARAIGVSNFNKKQIDRLIDAGCSTPAVNQIQLNAFYQQPELVKYLQDNEIVVTSYSTLGSPGLINFYKTIGKNLDLASVLNNPTVVDVAAEVGKSPGQVLLRHMIQKNIVVIPKSVTPERIGQNFEILDFELNDEQMSRINDLDQNHAIVDFKELLPGVENHPEYPF